MRRRSSAAGAWLSVIALAATAVQAQQLPAVASAPVAAQSAPGSAPAAVVPAAVGVVLHTTQGDIEVALDPAHAPLTAGNFLRYVDGKRFDGITFYRALKLTEDGRYGLVQGGLQGDPKRVLPAIAHESPRDTGLHNVEGAIAMAREAPGTATADFFIVIGDLSSLDGSADGSDPGYAVFGKVTAGMDIVKAMLDLPRSADAANPVMKGQMLAEPVRILSVRRAN